MARHTVKFSTRPFVRSHGKQPRGVGCWAFDLGDDPWFAPPTLSLADAKKAAIDAARRRAVRRGVPASSVLFVDVLP